MLKGIVIVFYGITVLSVRNDNVIQIKSFAFAIRIVQVFKFLQQEKHEFVISKQLLRSGTSIGSNVEESIGAQSKADFISKLSIAYKEARETKYWLKLLIATDYLTSEMGAGLLEAIEEICRIIGSIQVSAKQS